MDRGGDLTRRAGRIFTPDRLDRPFYDPLVERLFPPLATGVEWGLDRTLAALVSLGNPHEKMRALHVGGTNGKGSVASSLSSILRVGGWSTGLYTSPHLCSLRERYILNGRPVSEATILERAAEVTDAVMGEGLTFFEAITVLGFHLFAEEGAEVLVAEVGLGGRLDATNVLNPLVTTITNVAMDHADYLGDTLAEIGREKAGIIKRGVPIVTAETDPTLLEMFEAIAVEHDAPFVSVDSRRDVHRIQVEKDHTSFRYQSTLWGELALWTPLVGAHQATNAALTVATCEQLPEDLRPDAEQVREGLSRVQWPGRDQVVVVGGQTYLLDVAHNVAGVQSLVDTLGRLDLPRPWVGVLGVLGDKDWPAMLPPLLRRLDASWLTLPASGPPERKWDPEVALAALLDIPGGAPCPLEVERDFSEAVIKAEAMARGGTVVITGSVYTVGGALQALGEIPFE